MDKTHDCVIRPLKNMKTVVRVIFLVKTEKVTTQMLCLNFQIGADVHQPGDCRNLSQNMMVGSRASARDLNGTEIIMKLWERGCYDEELLFHINLITILLS